MTESDHPLSSILSALRRPEAYPARPDAVDVRETHISVVFLAGDHVYKLKKPVDFGFLDFTTLEKRRYFCQREVALNRRTSPDVYLGVVSIVPSEDGGYRIGDEDDPAVVEYAVHMARLPQEEMLDERLTRGTATPEMLRSLGRLLAAFHREAETGPEIAAAADLEGVRVNVEENFSQTEPYIGRTITGEAYDAIKAYARDFMTRRATLFHTRAQGGFARDSHGDLHASQVCILDDGRIAILDCIEFNDRFRWGDTASDVAFMTMDLEARGHLDLARAFLDGYTDEADSPGLGELLPFYQCYRAYVRAKVEGFRLEQTGLSEKEAAEVTQRARRYFDLAAQYARTSVGPHLVLIGGLMGSGKTTLVQALARSRGFGHLSSDVIRKELAGVPTEERRFDPFDQGIYSPELTDRTYHELTERAQALLEDGRSVVVDASFSRARDRARFRALSKQTGVPLLLVLCDLSEEAARERLDARVATEPGASDGRWDLYARQRDAFEIPADFPARSVLRLNTEEDPNALLSHLMARLDGEPLQ